MKTGLAMVLAACLGGAALADEVTLSDGRVLEGIARRECDRVVIETGMGTVTVPADEVCSIVPGRSDLEVYQEQIAALGSHPDAAAVFDAATWAQKHHLTRYVNTLLQWTLALDPDHAQARKLLDYVRFEGRWIPAHDREELLKARAQPKASASQGRTEKYVRRSRPMPEISPGYVYFGIPPSSPPRGSQNHGYGESTYFSYPYPPGSLTMTR
jgi:hypothetical protein